MTRRSVPAKAWFTQDDLEQARRSLRELTANTEFRGARPGQYRSALISARTLVEQIQRRLAKADTVKFNRPMTSVDPTDTGNGSVAKE